MASLFTILVLCSWIIAVAEAGPAKCPVSKPWANSDGSKCCGSKWNGETCSGTYTSCSGGCTDWAPDICPMDFPYTDRNAGACCTEKIVDGICKGAKEYCANCVDAPEFKVVCEDDKIKVTLREEGRHEFKYPLIHTQTKCQFVKSDKQIDIAITDCGTTAEVDGDNIVYKNEIKFTDQKTGTALNTIHRGEKKVPIQCSYPRKGKTGDASWSIEGETVVTESSADGTGTLVFHLKAYEDDSYAKEETPPMKITGANINDAIYMEVSVVSKDPDMTLGIVDLIAADNNFVDGTQSVTLEMIKNGCKKDETLQYITYGADAKKKRFKFNSFEFSSQKGQKVYVNALVQVCTGAKKDECTQEKICPPKTKRRRREAPAIGEETPTGNKRYHVYQGPWISEGLSDINAVSSARMQQMCSVLPLTAAFFLQ